MQFGIGGCSAVCGDENPESSYESVSGRSLAAEIRHHAGYDHLLDLHLSQYLLHPCPMERAVCIFFLHHQIHFFVKSEVGEEICVRSAIEDEFFIPPLTEHSIVRGGLVVVAGEQNGNFPRSAKVDCGIQSRDDGICYVGEVILHVDHQKSAFRWIRASLSDLVLAVGGQNPLKIAGFRHSSESKI